MAAAKAMRCGNWNACATFIVNKKMNTKVWDLFYEADRVREMLIKFIKEESLRTYLFTYSNVYSSISIPSLAAMFDLSKPKVHSLISKMIINEELMASLDDPSETVVMHRSEPSRLQALSMQLADKVTNLVDANERIFEMKQGNFFQNKNQVGIVVDCVFFLKGMFYFASRLFFFLFCGVCFLLLMRANRHLKFKLQGPRDRGNYRNQDNQNRNWNSNRRDRDNREHREYREHNRGNRNRREQRVEED